MTETAQALIQETLEALRAQSDWLSYSSEQARLVVEREQWQRSEYDTMEALSSRFARAFDYLVRKAFRLIDELEYETQGSLLDVVHHAEKRGLVRDLSQLEKMRDLRNRIAHEYAETDLLELFRAVHRLSPALIAMLDQTAKYLDRLYQSDRSRHGSA